MTENLNENANVKPILVLGGTGKTGRPVVERLEKRGLPVRVGSRSGTPPFEWGDRSTWPPVLDGVGAMYLAYVPDLCVPGATDDIRAMTALAREAGVERIVLLSGRGEDDAKAAEDLVAGSGIPATMVRAGWFVQNFSEDWLLDPVLSGEVALPIGDVPEPFVDTGDIADVAVAALVEDGHDGKVYEVTGPRALSFADAAAEIAAASGRQVAFTTVPMAAFVGALREHGVPDEVADLMEYLFTTVLDGRNVRPAAGVKEALGREPRDFSEVVRELAAAGAWA